MQFSVVALFAGFVGFAAAQGGFGLPDCATGCAANSLPKQCPPADVNCICQDSAFITGISCCVATACSPSDQQKTLEDARKICSGANVVLPEAASCSNGTNTTTTSPGSSGITPTASSPTNTGAATRFVVQGMGIAGAVLGAVVLL